MITLTSLLFSQSGLVELRIVGTPKQEPSEIVAKSIKDNNGDVCAGLIIYSDLKGLSFQANNGIVKRNSDAGKDFLFLSPDERVVDVFCSGYFPLKIILNDVGIRLKSGQSWSLKITGDKKLDLIPVNILVKPEGAAITIDGANKGTASVHQLSDGSHELKIEKEGYKTVTEAIDISITKNLFTYTLQEVEQMENWFYDIGLGYAYRSYPTNLQKLFDAFDSLSGVSGEHLEIDLGFYWALNNYHTALGFAINGGYDDLSMSGASLLQISQLIYGASVLHYFDNIIGDGLFVRGDVGVARLSVRKSSGTVTDTTDNAGFGILIGSGYAYPITSGTRLLLNLNFSYSIVAGGGVSKIGISVEGLF